MFCVFLPALNFRGSRSPYLWWFYKLVSAFGSEACYLCGEEYFADPALHLARGRHDASGTQAQRLGYAIPDAQVLSQLARHDVPTAVWKAFENRFSSNPLKAFEHFCLQLDDELYEAFSASLDRMETGGRALEAVIACVNCATLRTLCRRRGIRLIHVELGPLRGPSFLQTAYFDFSGVNGCTEAQARFQAARNDVEADEWHGVEALRSLFMTREIPVQVRAVADLGLALQVEDDSNTICYSNGFSSSSLLNQAQICLAENHVSAPVLVRTHPGSFFRARDLSTQLVVDQSDSAIEFILRCRRIHTINSSVAVEAMLLARETVVFGDSPFTYCIDPVTHRADESALSFFLLNYLVPWEIAFSTDYIRWRLTMPPEQSIRQVHLERFMQDKIKHLEARVRDLETQISDLGEQVTQLRSSIPHRVARGLRSLYRNFVQRRARR